MADIRLRKQRSPEEMLSENAGKMFSPPTVMYDAACCAEDAEHGRRNGSGLYGGPYLSTPYSGEDYQHKARLVRLTTMQGCSTMSRDAGDFDYIGGTPKRLMNGDSDPTR